MRNFTAEKRQQRKISVLVQPSNISYNCLRLRFISLFPNSTFLSSNLPLKNSPDRMCYMSHFKYSQEQKKREEKREAVSLHGYMLNRHFFEGKKSKNLRLTCGEPNGRKHEPTTHISIVWQKKAKDEKNLINFKESHCGCTIVLCLLENGQIKSSATRLILTHAFCRSDVKTFIIIFLFFLSRRRKCHFYSPQNFFVQDFFFSSASASDKTILLMHTYTQTSNERFQLFSRATSKTSSRKWLSSHMRIPEFLWPRGNIFNDFSYVEFLRFFFPHFTSVIWAQCEDFDCFYFKHLWWFLVWNVHTGFN